MPRSKARALSWGTSREGPQQETRGSGRGPGHEMSRTAGPDGLLPLPQDYAGGAGSNMPAR